MAWVDVGTREQVARVGMMEIEARGAALLLYDVAGTIYATAAVCPHHAAWFSQGGMDGEYVDCPRHQGRFHIPTGTQVRGPECPALRTYPVRVSDGRVLVSID
jgi:nitrite reductase/ring-hydroxylating ferredoxin subunit